MATDAERDDPRRSRHERTITPEARGRLEDERTLRAGQLAAIEKTSRYATDELMLALLSIARSALEEVNAALQRMEEGAYGLCQGCEARIPARRLGILPHTRFCAPCQRQRGER